MRREKTCLYHRIPLPNTLVNKQIDRLVEYARKYIGTPYRRGSKGPNRFDCSGFTQYIFNHFSYSLNASSASQYLQGISVKDEEICRGDLVFFKGRNSRRSNVGHVGLVTEVYPDGRFKFIHASTSQGIREDWNLLCSTICRSPTHLFRSNRQTTDFRCHSRIGRHR